MDLRFRTLIGVAILLVSTQIVLSFEDNEETYNGFNEINRNNNNIEEIPEEGAEEGVDKQYPETPFQSSRSVHYSNLSYSHPDNMEPHYYQHYRTQNYQQFIQNAYSGQNYNYRQPMASLGYNAMNVYNQTHVSGGRFYNENPLSSYQNIPGTYHTSAYGKQLYFSGQRYNAEEIYSTYLASGAYQYHSKRCANHYGQTPMVTVTDMESAFDYARHQMRSYDYNYVNSSAYSSNSPPLQLKEKEALLMEYVTQYFAKYKCMSKYQTTTFLPSVTVGQQYMRNNRYGDTSCYSSYGSREGWQLKCGAVAGSKYRTIDGSCNNLKHPYWGKSYVCHIRLLPPDYADGVSEPRRGIDGRPLPNARLLSTSIASDKPFDAFYTHMKYAFGQFANHDITHTPVHGGYKLSSSYSGPVDCCKNRGLKHCYPIDIIPSPHDYLYRNYNVTCLNFVRSAPCPLCELGPRQQSNIATSFLDAGTVYGNTVNESVALRTFRFGLLKTSKDMYGKPILLATPAPWHNQCSPSSASMQCFTAGDQRVNQHPSLMCMHLIFHRRHNEHATALRLVNPHWNDEVLYQESRRLTIAELQHCFFNEYLPIIFGSTLMNYYSLNTSPHGYTNYEPKTDPTSWNEYATAACRFGHSQAGSMHRVLNKSGDGFNTSDSYNLRNRFMDPSYLWNGKMDGVMKGLLTDFSHSVDPYYTKDMTNYLMRKKGERYGSDIMATNLHRGRGHGTSSYVNYLKYCFGFQVRSWDDIKLFIPEHIVNLFRHIYGSYENIDLYIAGISEHHFPDADVGPTFACILGIQYYHIKFGDRFYYEHGGQSGSFKLNQLNNIRKTTSLARLICRTSDYMGAVQRYAFFPVSKYNKEIPCKDYPEINYQLWKESPHSPQRHY